MFSFNTDKNTLSGSKGTIKVPADDGTFRKFAMLFEGECEGMGPCAASRKYGYTRQRYHQLVNAFISKGVEGLQDKKRGPRKKSKRTEEVIRQIIRYRFMDPDCTEAVIAQKLRQTGWAISIRSVDRVISEYGLQKKTPPVSAKKRTRNR